MPNTCILKSLRTTVLLAAISVGQNRETSKGCGVIPPRTTSFGCVPMSLMPVNTWRSPLRALFASASRFEGNRARYVSEPMAAAFAAARSNSRFAFGKKTIPNVHALRAGADVAG